MNRLRVSDFMSRRSRDNKVAKNSSLNIVAYPQNDVTEIAKIMNDVRIDCLPVVSSPWNKKLVGFIELNKIRVFLND